MMQERVRRRAKKAVGQVIAGTAVNDPKTVVLDLVQPLAA
jgi:hypothetical protein